MMQCSDLQTQSKMNIKSGFALINSYFRSIFPAIVIIGVVPQLYTAWLSWRVLSFFLPSWMYQKGDDAVLAIYQRIVIYFFEHWVKAEILFYGDTADVFKNRERVLYISNHQSTVDWIIVGMLAIRQGSEGNLRFIMKNQLQFIPMIGLYLLQHGCIYVQRGNFNREKMLSGLNYLQNKSIPSWMVIFPEGTRYNPESKDQIEKNRKFAESQGLQPLTHCSMPKSRGFCLMLQKMRENVEYVYNTTIIYEDAQQNGHRKRAPSMFEFVKLDKPRVHIHVQRIPISSIPKSENDIKTWLNNAFSHTDRLLSKFFRTATADEHPVQTLGEPLVKPLGYSTTIPSVVVLTAITVLIPWWNCNWYWKIMLINSVGSYIWLGFKSMI